MFLKACSNMRRRRASLNRGSGAAVGRGERTMHPRGRAMMARWFVERNSFRCRAGGRERKTTGGRGALTQAAALLAVRLEGSRRCRFSARPI